MHYVNLISKMSAELREHDGGRSRFCPELYFQKYFKKWLNLIYNKLLYASQGHNIKCIQRHQSNAGADENMNRRNSRSEYEVCTLTFRVNGVHSFKKMKSVTYIYKGLNFTLWLLNSEFWFLNKAHP